MKCLCCGREFTPGSRRITRVCNYCKYDPSGKWKRLENYVEYSSVYNPLADKERIRKILEAGKQDKRSERELWIALLMTIEKKYAY